MTTTTPEQTDLQITPSVSPPPEANRPLLAIGRWGSALTGIGGYLFLYTPIIVLVVFSFNASRFSQSWDGFTLDWYREVFEDDRLMRALQGTMYVATISTTVSTVLGTMIAIGLERYRVRARAAFDTLLYLPIITPDIAMAMMLLLFFSMSRNLFGDWIKLGSTTVIIAHVSFNISFVAVVVRARLVNLDPNLEEAARDLYANEWQTFWRVTFPLILPGVLAGALLAFTLSLDDAVITTYVTGPGFTTLPIRVLGQAKTGITPKINALSTLMVLVSMSLLFISLVVRRRSGTRLDIT